MKDLFLRVETAGEGLDGVRSYPQRRMTGHMDAEILARGRRRHRGRPEDLRATLGRKGQARARVETDGEIDAVAGHEAAAVGEEEEERDAGGRVRRIGTWRTRGPRGWQSVGTRGEEFQGIGVGEGGEGGRGWWE